MAKQGGIDTALRGSNHLPRTSMPGRPDLKPLGVSGISAACGNRIENAQQVQSWLLDRGDEAIFACSGTKLSSGTDRLVIVSRYRLLLVRWKFRRPAFKELRLLDLRGMTCEGNAGAWGFTDGVTAQIQTSRLQEAAHATLHAHALITLCVDVPPLALALPTAWGALGFANEGKEIDMVGCTAQPEPEPSVRLQLLFRRVPPPRSPSHTTARPHLPPPTSVRALRLLVAHLRLF